MLTLSTAGAESPPAKRRIEILGVFGSGKTTLATRLARTNATLLPEDHERNPFWGDEASVRMLGYLGYDLSFLLQHAHLVSSAPHNRLCICDWSFATDLLWASLRLDRDLAAYKSVHAALMHRLGPSAGYLFLRQTPETIVERLERRSRRSEESFRQYVRSACAHLESLVAQLPSNRVLLVDDDMSEAALHRWIDLCTEEAPNG